MQRGVTASWTDTKTGMTGESHADWMVCTIPATVLGQIQVQVSDAKKAAIKALPYGNSVKIGLEMKSRFWETEDAIYGGSSFTDQAIGLVSYPSHGAFSDGPAVLLGAYPFGVGSYILAGMTPEKRIAAALEQGSVFHPKHYKAEFLNGVSVAWSRMPWILGCCATWTEESRAAHYQNLVSMDGRIVLAGEHCREATARRRRISERDPRHAVDHGDVIAEGTDRGDVDVDLRVGILFEEGGEHLPDRLAAGGGFSGVDVDVLARRAPVRCEGRRIMAIEGLQIASHHTVDAGDIRASGGT